MAVAPPRVGWMDCSRNALRPISRRQRQNENVSGCDHFATVGWGVRHEINHIINSYSEQY